MTQEFVTLPRETVEQALKAMEDAGMQRGSTGAEFNAIESLRAALEQPVELEPVAWIENFGGGIRYNPYHDAARKLPDGVRFDLYTHPQNLNCKSNQARLATLWGYVKADQQPQVEQEPVAWQYRMRPDWGIKKDCWGPWQDCTREQAAMYQRVQLLHDWVYETRQLYTHPQPRRDPLPDHYINGMFSAASLAEGDMFRRFARAIEAAHNIK